MKMCWNMPIFDDILKSESNDYPHLPIFDCVWITAVVQTGSKAVGESDCKIG